MNNDDLIISLLKGINDNIGNVSSGGSTINPDELIPLEPLPTPPEDTLYYRTYVDDVVYIGSNNGALSGYAGADSLGNIYLNHRGVLTLENLKESLESPSAQVGVLNEFITEISVPDNVNILGRAPSKNLKTIIANNVWEMSQDFKGTLWYTQKEQGPVKLGSLLFGYKGTVPAEIPLNVTQDIKNINSSAFIGTDLETITLSDSIEKVGTKAFYETPFIQTFQDQPIYFGKTLYDITGTYTVDTFDIPEGIKYINVLGQNVMPYQSGTSGYNPSGDSGVGDIESRDFFNVSINRINIPSTAILTENPFGGVKDLTYLGFPQILPTMSEYWLGSGSSGSSGSSGISGSTGGVQQAYYDGTVQQFKDQLQITGTDWIDNSSIIVVYCTDGEFWLEDVTVATYTTYDGSTIPGSLGYGKLIVGDDFHLSMSNQKLDANSLESIVFDECTIKGQPYYYESVFNNRNVKHIDLSKVYLDNSYSPESSSIPTAKYCSQLETYLSPYEIGPDYYNAGDILGTADGYNYVCVPNDAFSNCSSLHTITLPRNLSIILSNAFDNCTSLNNIILPNTVKYIGSYAFNNCTGLTEITSLNPTPPTIQPETFYGVDKSIPLYVPNVEAYQNAENWNEFFNIQPLQIPSQYELTVSSSDETMGTVQVDYHNAYKSSITAIPNEGYAFIGWYVGDEMVSNESTYKFVASEDLTLVANFEVKKCSISSNIDRGNVTNAGIYDFGTEVTIEAIPNEGYEFYAWSDGNTENPRTVIIENNLTAIFNDITGKEIYYTTTDGNIVTPSDTAKFGSNLIDNQYN